ncbi:hypothetical protein ABPG72_005523 [Tetrahymena utriculariae]
MESEFVKPISHQLTVQETIKDNKLRISLIPPLSIKSRTNSNICCVVDVSGSMGIEAKANNSVSSTENYCLSILDIVQHALKMIVNTLTPHDDLSVVAFSSQASIVFDTLKMDDANKTLAIDKIEKLQADGSTNLWDGIRVGLNILSQKKSQNRNQAMYVLTDGQPDDRQVMQYLKKYKKDNPNLRCTISTFGFGSSCDSELLDQIAREYNGMYSFIPDATLIATAFANALANTLTVFANYVKLRVKSLNSFKFKAPPQQPISSTSKENDVTIYGGVVNIQQNRDYIIDILEMPLEENQPYAQVEVIYQESFRSDKQNNNKIEDKVVIATLNSREYQQDFDNHIYRYKLISAIDESIKSYNKNKNSNEVKNKLMNLVEEMEQIHDQNDRHFDGIYKDLVRTVSEAFKDNLTFKTWGEHYITSLLRAHLIQQCNTFKDPGVQHYGKDTFKEIRAVADETFVKMPPPKPYSRSQYYDQVNTQTQNVQASQQSNQSSSSYSSAYNMNDYHNYSSGGCMHGESRVQLSDFSFKTVSEVKKGDKVICPILQNQFVEVECVVLSKCENGTKEFVQLGSDLWITPKHPIRVDGEWKYPKDLGQTIQKTSHYIYQFVLKSGHTMNIGGYECICLGHNFQERVAHHPYLGSQAVIEDLKSMKGWNEGKVVIRSRIKDQITGQVKAFIQ